MQSSNKKNGTVEVIPEDLEEEMTGDDLKMREIMQEHPYEIELYNAMDQIE